MRVVRPVSPTELKACRAWRLPTRCSSDHFSCLVQLRLPGESIATMAAPLAPGDIEVISLSVAGVCMVLEKEKRRSREKWSKEWLLKRQEFSHTRLLTELKLESGDWFNYLRMDQETYLKLLSSIEPLIKKEDTCMRKSISPRDRLTATLRFLATGRSYEDLKFSTAISAQALGKIVPETCTAIWTSLRKEYLKFPDNVHQWMEIAKDYEEIWDFPHCLGAVDGKHVSIVPPSRAGSYYYNYKGSHSLVLMTIVNAKYEFIMVDFGVNGRVSDGGVIENSRFYELLCEDKLPIPPAETPLNSDTFLPFVFVGDEAFALRKDFMKPFNQKELNHDRKIFNYRLSRARRVVDNVFGIMASRFRIFNSPINLKLENITAVVMACCTLHNFLHKNRGGVYISPEEEISSEDKCTEHTATGSFVNLQRCHYRKPEEEAKEVREQFLRYFNTVGSVLWQEQMIY